jgi:6-phosphogluconolactonase
VKIRLLSRCAVILLGALLGFCEKGLGADAPSPTKKAGTFFVFIGTYTGSKSKGIQLARWDASAGTLGPARLAAETANPAFLALHPNGRFLYAASEIGNFEGKKSGAVAAFAVEPASGNLTLLNTQASGGSGPCHVSVDASGRCALVANYGSGSVAALPIRDDGSLGEAASVVQHHGSSVNRQRQQGPHAHQILTDAANRFALVCDLGLDQVLAYRVDPAKATLTAADPPFTATKAGCGPRHLAFHPKGKLAYVVNELDSTLTAFAYDGDRGALKELQTVPLLPADFKGASTAAEVQVHPSGRFVYASNRGHDSIAVFAIDEKSGKLTFVQHEPSGGKTPRFFTGDPTGQYLLAANQDSDNVVIFRIDGATGRLEATGRSIQVGSPVCLKFLAAE